MHLPVQDRNTPAPQSNHLQMATHVSNVAVNALPGASDGVKTVPSSPTDAHPSTLMPSGVGTVSTSIAISVTIPSHASSRSPSLPRSISSTSCDSLSTPWPCVPPPPLSTITEASTPPSLRSITNTTVDNKSDWDFTPDPDVCPDDILLAYLADHMEHLYCLSSPTIMENVEWYSDGAEDVLIQKLQGPESKLIQADVWLIGEISSEGYRLYVCGGWDGQFGVFEKAKSVGRISMAPDKDSEVNDDDSDEEADSAFNMCNWVCQSPNTTVQLQQIIDEWQYKGALVELGVAIKQERWQMSRTDNFFANINYIVILHSPGYAQVVESPYKKSLRVAVSGSKGKSVLR
ncbi:hypothetical protein JAAARDRAFT_198650 [Jaapia argillacea MUCL 33604]|uniref:Uncharacterized protein n=1 Tax=Jaapia argillacea MUCL 33604 TaxID=933084 RepID=A0A067PLW5_9AGAM|nr:hypothetical protein JAAARDRAFT_198650 [Jaapia argillacea MUCL 33604]